MGRDWGFQAEKRFLALTRLPVTPLKGHPCLSKQMILYSQILHRQVKLRPAFPASCCPHFEGETRETRIGGEERTRMIFKEENFSSEGGEALVQVFQRGGGCWSLGTLKIRLDGVLSNLIC